MMIRVSTSMGVRLSVTGIRADQAEKVAEALDEVIGRNIGLPSNWTDEVRVDWMILDEEGERTIKCSHSISAGVRCGCYYGEE